MCPRQRVPQGSRGATPDAVSSPVGELPVVLIVSPSRNADGRRAYSGRGQLFDGKVNGQVVVERSPTPFSDGARRLVEFGHDGNATLVMKHAGSNVVALSGKLSIAAGLTVREDRGVPQFVRYHQMPCRLDAVTLPSALGGSAGRVGRPEPLAHPGEAGR